MAQHRFSADGESPRSTALTEAVKCVCFVVLMLLMFALIVWGIRGFGLEPPNATDFPPSNAYGSFAYPVASPVSVVVQMPDRLVVVTETPLPATPTPTSTYVAPTKVLPLICGSWMQTGEVCEMPPMPEPTNTPIPPCPVGPGDECVWTGRVEDASPVVTIPTPWVPAQQSRQGAAVAPMVML